VEGRGSETLRLPYEEHGAEPDECYDIGQRETFPRLVIEVIKSSPGLNKFRLYAGFGIEEFWRWVDGDFRIYRLEETAAADKTRAYVSVDASQLLPGMTQSLITELLALGSQTDAVQGLRRALADNPPG
ncbi:MAG: Uma2 family endonuclease, partial [Myxococcota bacterium]